ncbi:preprotein translocase subunit SecG [Teredinibacter franksiae]|jgi:protein translocase subunit secG|uniref:preprotein translocase subunit SecG n=1 Tax=Teredinibacter franksiae TaxID=2761453 RepID=UPI00162A3EA1|nr:preprotein translocase subunit SecG [Teredinibacter franksiae]
MENLILLVHLLTALAVIGLILLQQGKGAEMGASFGAGASQTLFGSGGSSNFFSRMTAILATVFFITSFSLALIAKQKTMVDDSLSLPELEQQAEIPVLDESVGDIPVLEGADAAVDSDIPSLDASNEEPDVSDMPKVPVE